MKVKLSPAVIRMLVFKDGLIPNLIGLHSSKDVEVGLVAKTHR
jgi:hypothetical protein